MSAVTLPSDWSELYATDRYEWQYRNTSDDVPYDVFSRRLGVVENMFDTDGIYWEGRADINIDILFELKTTLSRLQVQERFVLAWALVRNLHVLLSCGTRYDEKPGSSTAQWCERRFVYQRPKSVASAMEEARKHIVFVENAYSQIADPADFRYHAMNTARVFKPEDTMSKLFLYPERRNEDGSRHQQVLLVCGHCILDGLANFRILKQLSEVLNESRGTLEARLSKLLQQDSHSLLSKLPQPQEALYPERGPNQAKRRWHWAISRVLRHLHKPIPQSFQNPLRRDVPLEQARPCERSYPKVLDYSRVPPLNTAPFRGEMSTHATRNMARMCKDAGITVGSGCFTLVAMLLMHFEELRHPDIPLSQRLPFTGGFPINVRPFLSDRATSVGQQASCMLAFSDGVTLPFLPANLDFIGRFRVLGRLAHRQLRQYQKRQRTAAEQLQLGARSPQQLVPSLYLYTLDRMEKRMTEVDPERKAGYDIYGAYAPAQGGMGTCGISSVGDTTSFMQQHRGGDVSNEPDAEGAEPDLVMDLKSTEMIVRPRDGEFLVGIVGERGRLRFLVSCDTNAMDPDKMKQWKQMMEEVLDKDMFEDVPPLGVPVVERDLATDTAGKESKL